mgnify:FL=1
MNTLVVDEINKGKRLDSYISDNMDKISRSFAQKLIENQQVTINGKNEKASYKVCAGDNIQVDVPEAQGTKLKAQDIPVDVVYEDKDIIVANKPKGMVVHPANGNPDGTLVNAILAMCKDSLSGIGGEIRPGIVHRLDKDTSGLLIIAKNNEAHVKMSKQIQDRLVTKKYIALIRGVVKDDEATIDMPIARSKVDRKKMAVDKDGKQAVTHFKVIKRYRGYTLLEIKIDTGRTHQIRVHMAKIGYPVVGDMVYSNGKNEFGIEGQMLHAKSLEFSHPITGKKMHLEAPLPEYFTKVLEELDSRS